MLTDAEILAPKPQVAVCMPYYRQVEGGTALFLFDMAGRCARECDMMPIFTSGAYVEDNRNGCVRFALQTGIPFDWLFWIDSDMKAPRDALLRLLKHDKDIVGANYRQRTPPHGFVGHYADGRADKGRLLAGGLHRMSHLPTGLLLTRFDIYRHMPAPWFPAGNLDLGQPRDDVAFCNMARGLGYEIWCDHDLTRDVAHTHIFDIPWFSAQDFESGRVEASAEIDFAAGDAAAAFRAQEARQQYDLVARERGQARSNGKHSPGAEMDR